MDAVAVLRHMNIRAGFLFRVMLRDIIHALLQHQRDSHAVDLRIPAAAQLPDGVCAHGGDLVRLKPDRIIRDQRRVSRGYEPVAVTHQQDDHHGGRKRCRDVIGREKARQRQLERNRRGDDDQALSQNREQIGQTDPVHIGQINGEDCQKRERRTGIAADTKTAGAKLLKRRLHPVQG